MHNGQLRLLTNGRAKKEVDRQLGTGTSTTTNRSLHGTTTYPGIVRGRVRIINTNRQMQNMRQGEILVSVMTTPRLILAVKKAAAIVTDEGGITCHAAIVARELRIPCIVGTKHATQVLKDDDLVEVDAERGIC